MIVLHSSSFGQHSSSSTSAEKVQRVVLIEEFSSSTCPPCKTFNNNIFNPFLSNSANQGKFTCVNYRMNWPSSGDPYYTAEAGTRRTFYGVNSVPVCYIDAAKASTSSASSFNNNFSTAYNKPAKAQMRAIHSINGSTPSQATVAVQVTITPSEAISGMSLFIAVVEKLTTGNASTNGEKEFHYVMMKMVPDASGTAVDLAANTPLTVLKESSLRGTHIEEMNDLKVVAWIQSPQSKEIIQSVFSEPGNTVIGTIDSQTAPSHIKPCYYRQGRYLVVSHPAGALVQLYSINGKQVPINCNNLNTSLFDVSNLSNGCYIMRIVQSNTVSVTQRVQIID